MAPSELMEEVAQVRLLGPLYLLGIRLGRAEIAIEQAWRGRGLGTFGNAPNLRTLGGALVVSLRGGGRILFSIADDSRVSQERLEQGPKLDFLRGSGEVPVFEIMSI